MTLYRAISYEEAQNTDWSTTGDEVDIIVGMVQDGILTPVEPCVHGNYAPHVDEDEITVLSHERLQLVWCPGVGLEDTE